MVETRTNEKEDKDRVNQNMETGVNKKNNIEPGMQEQIRQRHGPLRNMVETRTNEKEDRDRVNQNKIETGINNKNNIDRDRDHSETR
jgi:hypothetical protein